MPSNSIFERPCVAALTVVGSLLVLAFTPADATANEPTVDNLTRLEAETSVLKARAKKLEVQAQIATRQAELAKLTAPAVMGDPTVRSVEGIGRQVYATLQLENGSTLDVKVGDVLPNGMKIESISPNAVVVEKLGKRRFRLGTTPVLLGGAATGGPGALPPVPAISLPLPGKGVAPR